MSESEEEREDGSSSEEDTNTREELDENDVKLQQMRRGAQKRGGQSKIAARFEGLVSYDEMLRKHAFQRMKDGLQKILTLHTAVELSSICGCLGLKVQEKASTSIHFITEYAYESNDLDGERIKHIMNFMWEGALWEYLHSIGHPVHSMRPDPKKTIIEIWEQGGLLGANTNGFVPHFIAREVKKRNEWIQSADIQDRLEKLRKAQDAAKHAERKVVSEHDYTNILSYFNQMSALRRLEQAVREYLISEIEIARSRVDSCNETAKFSRQQQAENEQYYMRIVDAINEQLALTESVCEERIAERYQVESDLQRLHNVLASYIEVAQSRQEAGGGTAQPLRMRELDEAAPGVRALHAQLQKYKQICDDADDALRGKARAQLTEVDRLNEIAEALQTELEGVSDFCTRETARADRAERALFYCQRQLARTEHKQKVTAQEAWFATQRFANKLTHQQRMARSLKPVLLAALGHSHRSMYTLARAALSTLELADTEELNMVFERACMRRQDQLSFAVRKAELARQAALASAGGVPSRSKKVKVAAKKKGGGDGSSKASAPSGKSSRASTPSEASRPNSRATTPKASASTKSAAAPSSSTKKKPAKKK
jgi:hypothetical protein